MARVTNGDGDKIGEKGGEMLRLFVFLLSFLIFNFNIIFAQDIKEKISDSNTFYSAPPIIYAKDGEGILICDFKKGHSEFIYKCVSPEQMFFPEEIILYKDYIIFGMYNKGEWFPSMTEMTKKYYILKKDGGKAELYSQLTFKEKKESFSLLLEENFRRQDLISVFSGFPTDIELKGGTSSVGIPQLTALFKNIDNKCVFNDVLEKTIYLWDLKESSMKKVIKCKDKLPMYHGGGGFLYPYLLDRDTMIYLEVPAEWGVLRFFGIGKLNRSYLKKCNLYTGEEIIIDKFNYIPDYPQISPSGEFIVYGLGNKILVKDIKSGKKLKIGTGHSYLWLQ